MAGGEPKLITAKEYAKKIGTSWSNVRRLLQQGRIPGARKLGEGPKAPWMVPEDAIPTLSNLGPAPEWSILKRQKAEKAADSTACQNDEPQS